MIFIYDKSTQDVIYQSSEINQFDNPNEGISLNISNNFKLDFFLMVNNEEFDNDDNPFGQFILHQYTNMANLSDTSTDL